MSVVGLLSAAASSFKFKVLYDRPVIDDVIFKLHYRITAGAYFVSCILCTAYTFFGNPIECTYNRDAMKKVLNTWCWVNSTYTYLSYADKNLEISPGVGAQTGNYQETFHAYYQWVPFFLFLQGIMFYFPHWVWKNWESGRVAILTEGLRGKFSTEEPKFAKQFLTRQFSGISILYAIVYYTTVILNFVIVVANMFFIDVFVGGTFLEYGVNVLMLTEQNSRSDYMSRVFPRMTKCRWHSFGASGSLQTEDSICILAVNIINEKLFIFFWFWFIILAILTGAVVLYYTAMMFIPPFREFLLKKRFGYRPKICAEDLAKSIPLGHFWMLHLLYFNLSRPSFHKLMDIINSQCLQNQPIDYGKHPLVDRDIELSPINNYNRSAPLPPHVGFEAPHPMGNNMYPTMVMDNREK